MSIAVIPNRDKRTLNYTGLDNTIKRYYVMKDCTPFSETQALDALIDVVGEYNTPFAGDANYLLKNIDLQSLTNDELSYFAIVTWQYKQTQSPPTDIVGMTISFSTDSEEVVLRYDQNFEPIINSCDDRFSQAIMGVQNIAVLDCHTTSTYFDYDYAFELANTVNRDYFVGFPERTLKFTDLKTTLGDDGFTIDFKLSYKPDTWDEQVVDNGFYSLQVKDGRLQKLPILRGMLPVSEPALLDGNGRELERGLAPFIKSFRVLREVSFSEYLLGQ